MHESFPLLSHPPQTRRFGVRKVDEQGMKKVKLKGKFIRKLVLFCSSDCSDFTISPNIPKTEFPTTWFVFPPLHDNLKLLCRYTSDR